MLPRNNPQISPEAVCGGRPFHMGFRYGSGRGSVPGLLHGTTMSHCISVGKGLETSESARGKSQVGWRQAATGGSPCRRLGLDSQTAPHLLMIQRVHTAVRLVYWWGRAARGEGRQETFLPVQKGLSKPENRGDQLTQCTMHVSVREIILFPKKHFGP